MIGGQTGAAVAELANEVTGSFDIGLPLGPRGTAALLPSGVAAFGEGLGLDAGEVRLYLALREAAHHRLFAHVPWLTAHLFGAVEAYARGMTVDLSRLEEAMPQIDISNPEAMRDALAGGELFRPENTEAQKVALARLETALALVEGWVSTVVDAAAAERLPHASALAEAIRRRRATGGPAERTFATLVGLELRPRRLREAAAIWAGLTAARGVDGRDAVWAHPDLMPTAEDLDDPEGFVRGGPELDIHDLEADLGSAGPGSQGRPEGPEVSEGPEGPESSEGSKAPRVRKDLGDQRGPRDLRVQRGPRARRADAVPLNFSLHRRWRTFGQLKASGDNCAARKSTGSGDGFPQQHAGHSPCPPQSYPQAVLTRRRSGP